MPAVASIVGQLQLQAATCNIPWVHVCTHSVVRQSAPASRWQHHTSNAMVARLRDHHTAVASSGKRRLHLLRQMHSL
jgi:hypothetical protein